MESTWKDLENHEKPSLERESYDAMDDDSFRDEEYEREVQFDRTQPITHEQNKPLRRRVK